MINSFDKFKKRALQNKKVKEAYENSEVEFEIARSLIQARMSAKMTQLELALKMKTSQATIARYESGKHLPSLRTIKKYAHATGIPINIHIEA